MNAGQWGHLESVHGRAGTARPVVARAARAASRRGGGAGRSRPLPRAGCLRRRGAGPADVSEGDAGRAAASGTRTRCISCSAPPWGELIAVNANTGDIAWRVPLGAFDELEAKGIKTGTPSLGGAHHDRRQPGVHRRDDRRQFRAFDARNGTELWSEKLEAPAHSIPSTYIGATASNT